MDKQVLRQVHCYLCDRKRQLEAEPQTNLSGFENQTEELVFLSGVLYELAEELRK